MENCRYNENICYHIFKQIAYAIEKCHHNNIIHRDIKLENILIRNFDKLEYPNILLADFGFAIKTTTTLNDKIGTPLYVAPEIISNVEYDEKVDIWAMGILLYELYYGYNPFDSNTHSELYNKIVNNVVKYPIIYNNYGYTECDDVYVKISEDMKNVISGCLEKNPDKRLDIYNILDSEWFKIMNIEYLEKLYNN